MIVDKKLKPVMIELAYNLESFNPVFTAVLLKASTPETMTSIQCP